MASESETLFLEPPHDHDPRAISHIAALPASVLGSLPEPIQDALYTLQESTSVVYASYLRLQDLLDERFERLTTISGDCKSNYLFFHLNLDYYLSAASILLQASSSCTSVQKSRPKLRLLGIP